MTHKFCIDKVITLVARVCICTLTLFAQMSFADTPPPKGDASLCLTIREEIELLKHLVDRLVDIPGEKGSFEIAIFSAFEAQEKGMIGHTKNLLAERFVARASEKGVPPDVAESQSFELQLVVTEMLANAIEWGNKYDPKKVAVVRAVFLSEHVSIKIVDQGEADYDPKTDRFRIKTREEALDRDKIQAIRRAEKHYHRNRPDDEGGRGIFITQNAAKNFTFTTLRSPEGKVLGSEVTFDFPYHDGSAPAK